MGKGFRTTKRITTRFSRFLFGFKKHGARPVYKCICECVFFIIGQTNIYGSNAKSGMEMTNEEFIEGVFEMITANDGERPKDKFDAIESLRVALGV